MNCSLSQWVLCRSVEWGNYLKTQENNEVPLTSLRVQKRNSFANCFINFREIVCKTQLFSFFFKVRTQNRDEKSLHFLSSFHLEIEFFLLFGVTWLVVGRPRDHPSQVSCIERSFDKKVTFLYVSMKEFGPLLALNTEKRRMARRPKFVRGKRSKGFDYVIWYTLALRDWKPFITLAWNVYT